MGRTDSARDKRILDARGYRLPASGGGGTGIAAPVISWRMTDGSGTTVTDDSGNGNHGTLSDASKWASTGLGNGSSYIDQELNNDRSYVAAANNAAFTNNLQWTMAWSIDTIPTVGRGYVGILSDNATSGGISNHSKYVVCNNSYIDIRFGSNSNLNLPDLAAPSAIDASGVSLFILTADITDNGTSFDYDISYWQDGISKDTITGTVAAALPDETGQGFLHAGRSDVDRVLLSSYGFWYWNTTLSEADRLAFEADPWGVAYA